MQSNIKAGNTHRPNALFALCTQFFVLRTRCDCICTIFVGNNQMNTVQHYAGFAGRSEHEKHVVCVSNCN